jgi:molybdenum cofactor guanylyltransferase
MENNVAMTAVILAGGKSSRMGRDKALLGFGEETILEGLVQLTASIFSETFIITSQSKNYQQLDLKGAVILNDFLDSKGPLAGLYTGLAYSSHQVSCVLTCDMPLVDAALLRKLAAAWQEGDDGVCPQDFAGRMQPFPGIYCRSSRHLIRLLLDRGETAMHRLFDILDLRPLMLGERESESLLNMNTLADYEQASKKKKEVSGEITNPVPSE